MARRAPGGEMRLVWRQRGPMASDEREVLPPQDICAAAGVLARAFHADPPFVHFLPDPLTRAALLPEFFSRFVRYGQLFGKVDAIPENPQAVSIWLPPRNTDLMPERERRAGLDDLPTVFGQESFSRFSTFLSHMQDLHHRVMPIDHWYLAFLGVDPVSQGRGFAKALLETVLASAQRDGLPCYLETFLARNVPFYQHHGFKIVAEGNMPESQLAFWTMRKDPGLVR
jgi:GNAT superfamily N-acetyltransferase